jgi:hypothetical protein
MKKDLRSEPNIHFSIVVFDFLIEAKTDINNVVCTLPDRITNVQVCDATEASLKNKCRVQNKNEKNK